MNAYSHPKKVSSRAVSASLSVAFAALLLIPQARATLLVYEGFDYNVTNAVFNTINPGTSQTPTGLSSDSNYNTGGDSSLRVQTPGLSLDSLPVEGGSLNVYNAGWTTYGTAKVAGTMPTITGDLFVSFLAYEGGTITNSNSLGIYINGLGEMAAISGGSSSTNFGIGAGKAWASSANATQTMTSGQTYFLLAQFTNVGTALTAENPGAATLWVLTAAQYNNFLSSGLTTDALNSASIGATATDVYSRITDTQTSGALNFDNTSQIQFRAQSGGAVTVKLDELRIGTTLGDVINGTAIPEPGTWGLLFGAASLLGALLFSRRRPRR